MHAGIATPPPPVDRHTPVNILPCPKLRLPVVTSKICIKNGFFPSEILIILINFFCYWGYFNMNTSYELFKVNCSVNYFCECCGQMSMIQDITSFCGHFTYLETLCKVVKWSMKWPNSIQWDPIEIFCSKHILFVTIYGLIWSYFNIRWRWSIWKSPITAHPSLSSNERDFPKGKWSQSCALLKICEYRRHPEVIWNNFNVAWLSPI